MRNLEANLASGDLFCVLYFITFRQGRARESAAETKLKAALGSTELFRTNSLGDWLNTCGLFEQIPSLIDFKAKNLAKYV